jgi:YHS domain-containing protein
MIFEMVRGRSRRLSLMAAASLVCVAGFIRTVPAGAETVVNTGHFGDVAIMGYDTVAYFTEGRATKGSPELSHRWLGATWYFAAPEHRDAFAASPSRYAPQYGGYCSAGVVSGEVSANIDPEAWSIVDGELYLNYSNPVREQWERDAPARIAEADAKWPEVAAKLTQ